MEPNLEPTLGFPAPYGRTCKNCSRAKLKCMGRNVGVSCERCHRLNKECHPSETVRQRNAKRSGISKTTQLEEKLDGLMSLLKSANQSTSIITDLDATTIRDLGHGDSIQAGRIQANRTTSSNLPLLTPTTSGSRSTSSPSPKSSVLCATEPSPFEAEEYLMTFRTQKLKCFPFAYIQSTVSAQHLLQERPFLWLCIMAISSKSVSQQSALSSRIRDMLGEKMLFGYERSIDLLLGLIVCIGWTNCQGRNKPSLSMFTHLAMSLVFDLGLNKFPPRDPEAIPSFKSYGCPKPPQSAIRTMEERRAVLGCFLVSSIISSYLQKIDALRWTPHMDECLQTLAKKQECPEDEILVQQVRLQLIVEKVTQVSWRDGEIDLAESKRPPSTFYLKTLQSELQDTKRHVPLELQQNKIVLAHLYSTELTINEIALSKDPILSNNLDFQRLDSLYACLNSTRSWFDVFFEIPPADYIGLPFSICSQLGHCLIALYRLSTLDDPAWDKNFVRNTTNHILILDQVASNMRQAAEIAGFDCDSTEANVFTRIMKMIRSVKVGWEAKMAIETIGSAFPARANFDETLLEALPIEFYNDAWLADILVPWDC